MRMGRFEKHGDATGRGNVEPVRFHARRDTLIAIMFLATCSVPLALVAVVWRLWPLLAGLALPLFAGTAILLMQWVWTHYTISDRDLIIRAGLYRTRLPLSTVREVRYHDGWSRNVYGFSRKQLHLLVEVPFRHVVRITPSLRDEFVAVLHERCPEMVIWTTDKHP